MRVIPFIFVVLLSFKSFSQEIPKEYRSSNTMTIPIEGDKGEFLSIIARSLISFDYEIENLDKEFFIISTKPLLVKNVMNTYIKVKLNDSKAEFQNYTSMELSIGGVNTKGFELSNFRGQKGSPGYEASMKLFQVVSSISSKIEYLEK
jgi:hypothetical protein